MQLPQKNQQNKKTNSGSGRLALALPIKKGQKMIIQYTEEQLTHIEQIRAKHTAGIQEAAAAKRESAPDSEERKAALATLQKLQLAQEIELLSYTDKCQQEYFQQYLAGNPDAIIEDAKKQVQLVIASIHKEYIEGDEIIKYKLSDWQHMPMITIKNKTPLLRSDYIAQAVQIELKLHTAALQDDEERLAELTEIIIDEITQSPYTDNSEVKLSKQKGLPENVFLLRRSPLQDITKYGLMNDKASAQLLQDSSVFQQDANGQLTLSWSINQAPQKREAVPIYMALTYEGTEGKITKKLTGYDNAVYNAVATRFFYWQLDSPQKPLYITPQEIWRTMNGKKSGDGQAKPSKAQVKRICASLDKMRFTRFQMDITNEIKEFDLHIDDERITDGRIETYLINSSKVEFVTDKGNTVQGYRLVEEPILYSYNRAKGHILEVPYEMLDTSAKTSDTENVTEFRNYLLQQIQLMKNAAEEKGGKYFKRSNVILLESIYKNTGILPPEERVAGKEYKTDASRQKEIRRYRQADRQKIEGILDAWKAKGWIKSYTVLNRNNAPIKERQQARGYGIRI